MLDRDLANLYEVDTKYLKRQVKRNIERFPQDFMFELTDIELENWRCQFGTSNLNDKMGMRIPPFAFTEQGVAQLSGVLRSARAIEVNIQIIRLFTKMRKLILDNSSLLHEFEKIQNKLLNHDEKMKMIFDYLSKLIKQNNQERLTTKIGFKTKK